MSILFSVKNGLGIPEDDYYFDRTLIMHINSVFSVLRQLGCGNSWDEFIQNEPNKLQLVKTYMLMRVRQLFDPPLNGTVAQALERQTAEMEWRISTLCDPGEQP